MSKLRATTETQGLERKFFEEARRMQRDLRDTMKGIGTDSELIFSSHALKKSGRLSRGMTSRTAGNVVLVEAHARNPESGYDYVGVTRFGHRKSRIYPTAKKALRTPWGPRASVRGFKPKGDWAQKALPQVLANARRQTRTFGHDIVVRLS